MADLVWTLPAQPNQTARWEEPSGGGGGGSQDLAQVLAEGGDPEGNPITGLVAISPSTDPEGDGSLVVKAVAPPEDYGFTLRMGPDPSDYHSTTFYHDSAGGTQITAADPGVELLSVQGHGILDGDEGGTLLVLRNGGAPLVKFDPTGAVTLSPNAEVEALTITPNGAAKAFSITGAPEIPATPDAQDIADVLVALGLATQAA